MSHTILNYVTDVAASARYYAAVLATPALEESSGFALFPLAEGLALGLWRRDVIEPAVTAPGGGAEIGIRVAAPADVDALHATWQARGAEIALPPVKREFGYSFVAVDPDGHRLRVFALADAT